MEKKIVVLCRRFLYVLCARCVCMPSNWKLINFSVTIIIYFVIFAIHFVICLCNSIRNSIDFRVRFFVSLIYLLPCLSVWCSDAIHTHVRYIASHTVAHTQSPRTWHLYSFFCCTNLLCRSRCVYSRLSAVCRSATRSIQQNILIIFLVKSRCVPST